MATEKSLNASMKKPPQSEIGIEVTVTPTRIFILRVQLAAILIRMLAIVMNADVEIDYRVKND